MRRLFKIAGAALGALCLAEIGAGYLNFQRGSERGLGLVWFADRVKAATSQPDTRVIPLHAVYQPENTGLRQAFEKSYAAEFSAFMDTARARSCSVVMVYMPTEPSFGIARDYYAGLAQDAGIAFIDMAPVKQRFGAELLYLSPGDIHPSRMLGHLTAQAVADHIRDNAPDACRDAASGSGALTGPWVNNLSEIRETAKGLAFRFTSDSHGFRSAGGAEAQSGRPSVLLIGDSFTYGTSLSDQDTWPAALQRRLPQHHVRNAGVGGISIVRQHTILKKAVRDARADMIILQVNETDLQGLSPHYWSLFGRLPAFHEKIAGFFPE